MRIGGSRKRMRNMRGGFVDFTSLYNNASLSLTDAWDRAKEKASNLYNSVTGSTSSTNIPYTPSTSPTIGGKRRRTRRMRGGFTDNTPLTGLASHAAPISDIKTAQPHNWVGGRTRRHRYRRSKSRKRR